MNKRAFIHGYLLYKIFSYRLFHDKNFDNKVYKINNKPVSI